ncbi:GumC family protein [Sinorhizobium numidicum]|uniref:GumC family protein n=1 Tax=Sinorhizobium numidicum TaxID=680248 RepID=A0ABY8CW08_9HYPH|nr:GumC family protein [Sinorhizobium numidicum]WEX74930.1 GumC family protein [Sinorhizobium numidicum]WEX80923.1 GumC family protein [Sinorhizobium numidicum]
MYRRSEPEDQGLRLQTRRRSSGGSLLDLVPTIDEEARPVTVGERISARDPDIVRPVPAPQPKSGGLAEILPGLHALASIGIDDVILWLRDGIRWMIIAFIVCVAGALAYALAASQRYTVYTDLVVDPSNLNVVSDDVFTTNPQRDAQLLEVESKLRILTSRNVLKRVVDGLQLANDAEFVKPTPLALLTALFSSPDGKADNELAAMRALTERVEARREERSFVVVLNVWSEDPAKAVTISDAIVDAFEAELFQSSAESAGRVAQNLNARLDELRRNVTEAEKRVEDFRRANGLQSSNNGELVSNQLSSELNTQVLEAQQRFIQAETRYKQMSAAIAQGQTASASVFESANMTSLRQQYNALQQQIGSMQLTYGEKHPRLAAARSERATLEAAINQEARRISERAKADYDRERSALDALRAKANDETSNVFADNEAQVHLRDLERDARTKAAIYETHLARTQQITERQQIDTTNIRVISRAVPPNSRSWPPRTIILLIGGAVLGLIAGVAMAVALGLWRYLRGQQPAAA